MDVHPYPPPDTSGSAIGSAAISADLPIPMHATALTHPPYDVMIFEAMEATESPSGLTRKAISDYIQQTYSSLPENHSSFLTHHLRSLKASGRIVISSNSYRLPRPGGSGRKRGRPPKNLPDAPPSPKSVVLGLFDDAMAKKGEAAVNPQLKFRSGRGRPPKKQKSRQLVEVALAANGVGRPKRGRGRPPKVTVVPFANEGVGLQVDVGPSDQQKAGAVWVEKLLVRRQRQGLPPRSSDQADQPKQSDQHAPFGDRHVSSVEYELLQKKVEVIQGRIRDVAAVLKPHFVGEASTNVRAAIIELEAIAALDIKAPLMVDLNVMPS
ncbi:hypothetical protein SAY86_015561 [Trapa natans]|uniref:H15 domain-containing protein n=1 Tax=Trapa natans TaxID=22666 RepID=A0AAN7QVL6_TRANT|nr:hypothetical protein SAY86_015561 [Trapa natans]